MVIYKSTDGEDELVVGEHQEGIEDVVCYRTDKEIDEIHKSIVNF